MMWRTTVGRGEAPWWLVGGWAVVELVGLLAWAMLAWALWRDPGVAPARAADAATGRRGAALIVVRSGERSVDAVAATVMAVGDLGQVTVLDVVGRDDVRELAAEAGVGYLVPHELDAHHDPLVVLAAQCPHEYIVLLDAGDVVVPDIVHRLVGQMTVDVAVVQGAVSVLRAGSAGVVRPLLDLDDRGGDAVAVIEERFEPQVLNPALGARGVAHLTGSGALVRTAALASLRRVDADATTEPSAVLVPVAAHRVVEPAAMEHARLTVALLAAGWRIAAVGGAPVVLAASADAGGSPSHEAVDSVRGASVATDPIAADRARAVAASAARLLAGAALRYRGPGRLGLSARLSLLAWSVQPLAGLRRSLFVALVVAAVLAGSLPVSWSLTAVLGLWLPWFALGAVALWSLSGGTLTPGVRSRAAMLCLGPSWRGATTPNGAVAPGRHVLAGAFGFPYGTSTAAAIVAIGLVLAMRGLSEQVTHTLAPMATAESAVLLIVALWTLASGLSALRLLTVRRLSGRATRVATSMFGTFDDRPVLIADLSPTGAAVVGPPEAVIGGRHDLELVIPTDSGCVSAVIPVTVRNVRDAGAPDGAQRLGVQFLALDTHVRDALVEFCLVEPLRQGLVEAGATTAATAGTTAARVDPEEASVPRRGGLRLVALVAVVGAAVSVLTPSTEAAPAPPPRTAVLGPVAER